MKKTGFTFKGRKTRRGFTLIELLVVMAILGLLATIGLASFRSSQIKGRDAQRKHDLDQIQRALEAYYNDKGEYISSLPAGPWQDTTVSGGALYMKEVPTDPTTSDVYSYSSDGTHYRILARLENEKDISIETCATVVDKTCWVTGSKTCNYGVSSANLRLCDSFP